jgi:hypothetical protein
MNSGFKRNGKWKSGPDFSAVLFFLGHLHVANVKRPAGLRYRITWWQQFYKTQKKSRPITGPAIKAALKQRRTIVLCSCSREEKTKVRR